MWRCVNMVKNRRIQLLIDLLFKILQTLYYKTTLQYFEINSVVFRKFVKLEPCLHVHLYVSLLHVEVF